MRRQVRSMVALVGAAALMLGGCARDGSESASQPSSRPASSAAAVPTAEELASALVTADDYDGTWIVTVPPDAQEGASGVITEEQQEMMPRIVLCDQATAESRAAAEAVRWRAFRQLDQSEADPIDMAAGDRVGHMILVQEYLTSGDPAEIEATFTALRDGMQACQGDIPAGDEGPGTTEPMAIPDVGEDRYGDLTTLEEAGGGAYWLLYNALVRQGPVLMDLQVVDIVMGDGVQPEYSSDDIATFLTIAADKLP